MWLADILITLTYHSHHRQVVPRTSTVSVVFRLMLLLEQSAEDFSFKWYSSPGKVLVTPIHRTTEERNGASTEICISLYMKHPGSLSRSGNGFVGRV